VCGRVAVYRPLDILAAALDARHAPGLRQLYQPGYNLAPTRWLPGLVSGSAAPVLGLYRWGLANRSFNARAETISTIPAFRDAVRHRRLALVVDGFFEWQAGDGPRRRPLFFRRPDGAPLAIAGLWEAGEAATMVTTAAGADLDGIHDRMPVLLEPDALDAWLSATELDRHELGAILRPAPAGTLVHHPVDPRVGDVRNEGPELIAPFEPPAEPLRLFG